MDHFSKSAVHAPQPLTAVKLCIDNLTPDVLADTLSFVKRLSQQLGGSCQVTRHEVTMMVNLPAVQQEQLIDRLDGKELEFILSSE